MSESTEGLINNGHENQNQGDSQTKEAKPHKENRRNTDNIEDLKKKLAEELDSKVKTNFVYSFQSCSDFMDSET